MFRNRRDLNGRSGFDRPTYSRPRTFVGCGCGGLGLSLLLSAVATLLANLFTRRL